MQPYWIGVSPDELVWIHAFYRRGPINTHLLPIHEDPRVFSLPLLLGLFPCPLLSRGELLRRFCHVLCFAVLGDESTPTFRETRAGRCLAGFGVYPFVRAGLASTEDGAGGALLPVPEQYSRALYTKL